MKIMCLITSVLAHRQAHLNCLSGETPWEIASHWGCWIHISLPGPEGVKWSKWLHACLQGAWSPESGSQTLPRGSLGLCSGSLGSRLERGLAELDTSRPLGKRHLWLTGGVLRRGCGCFPRESWGRVFRLCNGCPPLVSPLSFSVTHTEPNLGHQCLVKHSDFI